MFLKRVQCGSNHKEKHSHYIGHNNSHPVRKVCMWLPPPRLKRCLPFKGKEHTCEHDNGAGNEANVSDTWSEGTDERASETME